MKRLLLISLVLILSFSIVLAGCGGGTEVSEEPAKVNEAPDETAAEDEEPVVEEPVVEEEEKSVIMEDVSGELIVWGFWDFITPNEKGESTITQFNEVYPNVTVKPVLMEWQEQHDKLKTVIAAGSGVPDVAMIESGFWGDFNTLPGLDNLLDPPYNFGDFKSDIPEGNFAKTMSLDGKRMFGFGVDFPPRVTFYRQDLFEEAGIPTDPQELVGYMQDWENVMSMAEMLKAKERFMFWNANDPVGVYVDSSAPFNEKLEFQWNNEELVQLLDVAKMINQRKLASNIGFWSDEGKQAIKSGKMTMVMIGTWADGNLKNEWGGQDLAGKWRITALPGGMYAGNGGTFWAAPTQAANKKAAAAWIKFHGIPNLEKYEEDMDLGGTWVPSYAPAWELNGFDVANDPFFGDQPVKAAIREIIKRVPPFTKTPLDTRVRDEIFWPIINEAIEKNMDSKAALKRIQDDVERALATDIAKLKEQIAKQ